MKRVSLAAVLVLVWMVRVVTALTQQLTDGDIVKAMQAGQKKDLGGLTSDCRATAGFGAHLSATGDVRTTGVYVVHAAKTPGRIAFLAADGKRLYKPLTIEMLPPALKTETVWVWAVPEKPYTEKDGRDTVYAVAPPIENLVLKSKVDPNRVISPTDLKLEPVTFPVATNKFDSTSAVASFEVEGFMSLPAGDIDVVLVTTAGERRCKIGVGDQKRVFGR